jgi:16S rRNA (uracil1498-N3)-methyltransferase
MALPFFYISGYDPAQKEVMLDEDTSRHIVQVLRMKEEEKLNLTDGKGNLITAEIEEVYKKHCGVSIIDVRFTPQDSRKITIAISLIKNSNRFEWFLEKATEIGISEIIPLICERTEKEKFRQERMQGIIISAMLQSQQCWLPVLQEPQKINQAIQQSNHQQKFIAHCIEDSKRNLSDLVNESLSSQIILIGPEGDFTKEEIDLAVQHHFTAVSLGNTRLRTETAGVVAATLLRLV